MPLIAGGESIIETRRLFSWLQFPFLHRKEIEVKSPFSFIFYKGKQYSTLKMAGFLTVLFLPRDYKEYHSPQKGHLPVHLSYCPGRVASSSLSFSAFWSE
jgi:hypothetical protein